MNTDSRSFYIITSNIKARILLKQELGSGSLEKVRFFSSTEEADTEIDGPALILIDIDPGDEFNIDLKQFRNQSLGEDDLIIVFSIDALEPAELEALGADGSLKLPFACENLLSLAAELEKVRGCREEEIILFIDDSRLIHKMVDAILTPQGFCVKHAYNGFEGLRMAGELSPDLIITDIQMPEMDGYEVCRKIKEDDRLCGIPVLIQSSLTDGIHIDRGFESGADDYITKPINQAELISRINSFLISVPKSRETILVADNSKLISNMITTGLKKQGFDCLTASGGPEVLSIAEKESIDLFIISQVLSGMEGREVVRSLRRLPATKSCPIIMLSSRDSRLDLVKSRSAGVSEFISKPFSVERMLVTVEKLLAEYRFIKERDAMSMYLSEAAMDHAGELAKSKSPLAMRAEAAFRTILFTDIVGFTPLCEELPPEKVIELLNSYFDMMVGIIRENGGTIDKFIGDAIMAVFGGKENGAILAVKSGMEMTSALEEFNRTSIRPINIRIGINSGEVVLGDLGSQHFRRDYTLIGDAVNIAQRLEGAAPENRILVSDATMEMVKDYFDAESREPIALKGKQDMIKTHLILARKKKMTI
ncbi:MAG: response regulator [Spirochaetales bacterium]|nr:response regulator [Spirochaetales bacterium]